MSANRSVLLVTVDCLRADHVGAYGYERDTTPNIDALAASGTRFKHAFSNGMGTRFAFKGVNAGVYPLRIEGAGLPVEWGTTLAEHFSANGYDTAGFANNPFLTRHFNHHRGFDTFKDVSYWTNDSDTTEDALEQVNDIATRISTKLSDGFLYRTLKQAYDTVMKTTESTVGEIGYSDEDAVDTALDWRDNRGSDAPYFMWVHFMDAHHPYRYDEHHRSALDLDTEFVRNPPENIQAGSDLEKASIDMYDSMIRRVDEQIGRLVDGAEDDTSVILTGDHGEEFGTHDEFHTANAHNTMARVPMVVQSQAIDEGVIKEPVSHIDIAPTASDLAGINSREAEWDGDSMLDVAENPVDRTVYIGFEKPEYIRGAAIQPPWKYLFEETDDGVTDKLVNYHDDPDELEDLSDDNPEQFRELKSAWLDHYDGVMASRVEAEHPLWSSDDSMLEAKKKASSERYDDQQSSRDEENLEEIEEQLEHLGYK